MDYIIYDLCFLFRGIEYYTFLELHRNLKHFILLNLSLNVLQHFDSYFINMGISKDYNYSFNHYKLKDLLLEFLLNLKAS